MHNTIDVQNNNNNNKLLQQQQQIVTITTTTTITTHHFTNIRDARLDSPWFSAPTLSMMVPTVA
jgi:hypothetical protein